MQPFRARESSPKSWRSVTDYSIMSLMKIKNVSLYYVICYSIYTISWYYIQLSDLSLFAHIEKNSFILSYVCMCVLKGMVDGLQCKRWEAMRVDIECCVRHERNMFHKLDREKHRLQEWNVSPSLSPSPYIHIHTYDKINLFFSICTNNERSDNWI